jgi:hypothetical protein
MKNSLRYRSTAFALNALLVILLASPLFARSEDIINLLKSQAKEKMEWGI